MAVWGWDKRSGACPGGEDAAGSEGTMFDGAEPLQRVLWLGGRGRAEACSRRQKNANTGRTYLPAAAGSRRAEGGAQGSFHYLQAVVECEFGELVLDRVCNVVELGQEGKGLQ